MPRVVIVSSRVANIPAKLSNSGKKPAVNHTEKTAKVPPKVTKTGKIAAKGADTYASKVAKSAKQPVNRSEKTAAKVGNSGKRSVNQTSTMLRAVMGNAAKKIIEDPREVTRKIGRFIVTAEYDSDELQDCEAHEFQKSHKAQVRARNEEAKVISEEARAKKKERSAAFKSLRG